MNKGTIAIQLDRELAETLRAQGRRDHRSLSAQAGYIVELGLAVYERRREKLEKLGEAV